MRTSLFVIAALFIGAFGAHFLMNDRGYVLLVFRGYKLETSIPMLILTLIALYAAVRIAARLLRAPRNIGRAAGAYRNKRAREALTKGLAELSAGEWARGERLLARGAHGSDAPVLHYLGAARAAQHLGSAQRRDTWLKLAYEQDPEAAPAVLLTQAELQLEDGQIEEALATLQRLDEVESGNAQCLAMRANILEQLGEWDELRALLPRLRRAQALPLPALESLERRVQRATLSRAGEEHNPEAVRAIWRGLGRELRKDPQMLRAYLSALARAGDHERVARLIRKTLKSRWDDRLVELYSELAPEDAPSALKVVEDWLARRGDDPSLLLAAARLSMRAELWGKARSYLESSLALHARADAYELYGKLLEQMGEPEEAAGAFRAGLSLAMAQGQPALPALNAPAAHSEASHSSSDPDSIPSNKNVLM